MAGGGFDYSGFKQPAENVKSMEKDSVRFIEDFLLNMALRVLAKIKRRTPVDAGDLRGAWYLSGVARRGGDFMVNIINPNPPCRTANRQGLSPGRDIRTSLTLAANGSSA